MGHRIKKIKDLSLLGLFFTLILLSDGQALSVTIVAQPMLDAKTPTQAISSDTSSKESVDTPTKASDEEKKENDSSTKIIVSSPVDEPVSISSSIHTQLVLSQLEHLRKLKEEYQKQIDQTKAWPRWTCIKHAFKLGEEDPVLAVVKKQLAEYSCFAFSCDDPKEGVKEFTPNFDEKLMNAVKQFQRYHVLDDDGVIGPRTCKALNLSPKERLKKIELNIKRWEQLEPSLKGRYVLVNIPTYNLYAMEDSKVVLSQPVIVGSKSRQTPLFTTNMVSVVLNPSWGVPVKIFVEDKLRKVLNNPEYLDEHHYTVTDRDGQLIPSSMVDWSHVSRHYFPYTIRQLPGKYNALGNIKFILDNKDSIYMHGTPQVTLFNRAARAFSSGCVRLAAPRELAAWALEGTGYNSVNKIDEKIKGEQTITVSLSKHIPVHFVYITVWVDGEGKAVFSDDPYRLDK